MYICIDYYLCIIGNLTHLLCDNLGLELQIVVIRYVMYVHA
jgi:hypothetical protein